MCTIAVAWINAKYKAGYNYLFIGTVMVDISISQVIIAFLDNL